MWREGREVEDYGRMPGPSVVEQENRTHSSCARASESGAEPISHEARRMRVESKGAKGVDEVPSTRKIES